LAKIVPLTINGEKEPIDSMLRRFKKMVIKEEILIECKKREHFMSNREKRKFKQDMAIRRIKNKKYR
jgi:ribosomal protein S21